jgi:hypothetical protein
MGGYKKIFAVINFNFILLNLDFNNFPYVLSCYFWCFNMYGFNVMFFTFITVALGLISE